MRRSFIIGGIVIVVLAVLAFLVWRFMDSRQITTGVTIPDRLGEQITFLYSLSGDGRWDLYLLDIEDGTPVQLTRGQTTHDVAWLPDGDRVSFLDNSSQLYQLNVVTGALSTLRSNVGEYAWSPDGARLLWFNTEVGALMIGSADGGTPQTIASGGRNAAWSPDGTRLAYIQEYDDSTEQPEHDITVVQADGSGAQQIEREGQQSHPKWSLDGRYLLFFDDVFHSQGGLMGRNLMLYDLDTGEFTDLKQFVGEGEFPDWARDSLTLLFQQAADGRVCEVSLSGEVGKCEGVGSQPVWNEDNNLIAYERDFGGGELCVFSLNVPDYGVDRCFFDWEYQVGVVGWRP